MSSTHLSKMSKNVVLARMGEVTLKGLNRGKFEIQLKSNLKYRLRDYGKLAIYQSQSRIFIEAKEEGNPFFENDESAKDLMKAVTQVFGIVSVSLARKFEGGMEEILENAVSYGGKYLEEHPSAKTFKVESKRGDKNFPLKSPEISSEVGAAVLEKYPSLSVNVNEPDFILNVEVRDVNYVYAGKAI